MLTALLVLVIADSYHRSPKREHDLPRVQALGAQEEASTTMMSFYYALVQNLCAAAVV